MMMATAQLQHPRANPNDPPGDTAALSPSNEPTCLILKVLGQIVLCRQYQLQQHALCNCVPLLSPLPLLALSLIADAG